MTRAACFPLLVAVLFSGAWSALVAAHGGEDHTHDAAPAVTVQSLDPRALEAAAARRLPDGSLFVPKAVQRAIGVRHSIAAIGEMSLSVQLNGRVVADPASGGRVQVLQPGRIAPGPAGLPLPGQRVARGQVLAMLHPAASSIERGNQQERLAELEAALAIAERRHARYLQLEGVVPQKDVDTARDERDALRKRRAAVAASVGAAEALRAPVSGIVGATHVVAGQVVEAREVLFEIVDPARLAVEALAYDATLAGTIGAASATLPDGRVLPLTFLGGGRVLREQALPLLFRIAVPDAPVAVGQPLAVIVQTRGTGPGVALRAAALVKNRAGATAVWVRDGAERFVLRAVEARPLDAATAVVTRGLAAGERVVTEGATLLTQVR
ncbi:MAG: efflux RND transporter periplasmic adaptor subunit [Gammaproteobacteria bacterium]